MAPADLSRLRLVLLVVGIVAVAGLGIAASLETYSLFQGEHSHGATVTISVSPNQTGVDETIIVSGKVSSSSAVTGYTVFLKVDGAVADNLTLSKEGSYSFSISFAVSGQRTIVVGFTTSGSYADKANVYSEPVVVTVTP